MIESRGWKGQPKTVSKSSLGICMSFHIDPGFKGSLYMIGTMLMSLHSPLPCLAWDVFMHYHSLISRLSLTAYCLMSFCFFFHLGHSGLPDYGHFIGCSCSSRYRLVLRCTPLNLPLFHSSSTSTIAVSSETDAFSVSNTIMNYDIPWVQPP